MTGHTFDKIMSGLKKARAYARGKPVKGLRVHRRKPVNGEVAAVRLKKPGREPKLLTTTPPP